MTDQIHSQKQYERAKANYHMRKNAIAAAAVIMALAVPSSIIFYLERLI